MASNADESASGETTDERSTEYPPTDPESAKAESPDIEPADVGKALPGSDDDEPRSPTEDSEAPVPG